MVLWQKLYLPFQRSLHLLSWSQICCETHNRRITGEPFSNFQQKCTIPKVKEWSRSPILPPGKPPLWWFLCSQPYQPKVNFCVCHSCPFPRMHLILDFLVCPGSSLGCLTLPHDSCVSLSPPFPWALVLCESIKHNDQWCFLFVLNTNVSPFYSIFLVNSFIKSAKISHFTSPQSPHFFFLLKDELTRTVWEVEKIDLKVIALIWRSHQHTDLFTKTSVCYILWTFSFVFVSYAWGLCTGC